MTATSKQEPPTPTENPVVGVVAHELQVAPDDRDRGAQFVAGVGDEEISDSVFYTLRTRWVWLLFNMLTVFGDPRYRPSPWLRRRGAIGLSLMHEAS